MSKLALVLALALLAAAGRGGADAGSVRGVRAHCDPETKILAGVDWQRLTASSTGRELRREIAAAGAGLDWLDGVERVVISSPGTSGSGEERPPLVVAAEGRFDLARLKALALRRLPRVRQYRGVELLEEKPGSGPPLAVALVSAQLILLGDASAVRASLDSPAGSHDCEASPLLARAEELAAENDIWVVADLPSDLLVSHAADQAALAEAIQRAEAGFSLRDGFKLQATLTARSPEDAEKLAGGLQLLLAMKIAGRSGPDPTRNLQVFTDGPAVRLTLDMSDEELQALLRETEPALVAAVAPEARRLAEEAPQPRPRLIRIYGLAEGIREIPLGR